MATINVTDLDGNSKSIDVVAGQSLMELLRDAGYDEITAICGGCCSCATCHVHVNAEFMSVLAPIEEDEQALISMADDYDPDRSRLSCQIQVSESLDGLMVYLVEPE